MFCDYLINKWPPIVENVLVRSYRTDRISNFFTQYLQYLLQQFIIENPKYLFLQEIECENPRYKLDYIIVHKNLNKYFKVGLPKNLDWIALIESQWGNNNTKKINDFLNRDFPKLLEWETTNKNQSKIAILDMTGYRGDWKENHEYMFQELYKIANKDKNSNYTIIITKRMIHEEVLGLSVYKDWHIFKQDLIRHI